MNVLSRPAKPVTPAAPTAMKTLHNAALLFTAHWIYSAANRPGPLIKLAKRCVMR